MKTIAAPADNLRPPQDWRDREPTDAIRRAGLAWNPPIGVAPGAHTCEVFGRILADNLARRTPEDILAERRENALDFHREQDPIARGMLEFHIAKLDAELAAQS